MNVFAALVKKGLIDARWNLILSSLALFGLGWFFVFGAARIETNIARTRAEGREPRLGLLRAAGSKTMDPTTAAIEMALWSLPFVALVVCIWSISRAAASVAGEIERGSIDVILSRPISRSTFLAAQVTSGLLGIAIVVGSLVAGNLVGCQFNKLTTPLTLGILFKPALNLAAMGVIVFGYTFLFSAIDSVRWRANTIGSVLTLGGFILRVMVNQPTMEDWRWLEMFSIFKAYNPVEIVVTGETFAFNTGILSGLGAAFIAVGFVYFLHRDLPTPG